MTVAIHRSAALWIALFMLAAVGAQAAEPDFTFRISLETRDVPDVVIGLVVGCTIKDAAGHDIEYSDIEFSKTEIAKSVIIEVTFEDRTKVGFAKSWVCDLFLNAPPLGSAVSPAPPGGDCDQENISYWYVCGRSGEPFRRSVSGRIE